jgi:hypothetical protein
MHDIQHQAPDPELISVGHTYAHHIHLALLAHHGDASRAVAQRAKAGDVIGMKVRIHCLHQIELADGLRALSRTTFLGDDLTVKDLINDGRW